MEPLLLKELELIALIATNKGVLGQYIYESKLEYTSFSVKKYSFFEHEISKLIWKSVISAFIDNSDVKACIKSYIESSELTKANKKELSDSILNIWASKFDFFKLELIYTEFKQKTELRIAQEIIQAFQVKMTTDEFNLKEASDQFFMDLPKFKGAEIENQPIGTKGQIYFQRGKKVNSFLELEQELRTCKELHNIRWVLNCILRNESPRSDERIKEMMRNLGLELLFATTKS